MTALVSEKMMDPTPMQSPSHDRNSSEQFPAESPLLSPSPEAPDRTSSAPSPTRQVDPQVIVEFQLLLNFGGVKFLRRKLWFIVLQLILY